MTADLSGNNWRVLHGHVTERLRDIEPSSVHCVVTSPPYWGGIRDYKIPESTWVDGWSGCYGNEPTVEQYVAHTLEVFDGLRHVLRDDGVVFWNLGDCYADSTKWGGTTGGKHVSALHGESIGRGKRGGVGGQGNKSLVPFRVAIALQDAGWVVRQDIIWHKPGPMPEPINGWRWERCRVRWQRCPGCQKCEPTGGYILRRGAWRPTTAHEFILMVTKGNHYFCDAQQSAEQAVGGNPGNNSHKGKSAYESGDGTQRRTHGLCDMVAAETRNPRSVWSISSEAYRGLHFAAYPTMLVHKCIQASTASVGCCPACGAQYAPIVVRERIPTRPAIDSKVWKQDEADKADKADGQRSEASPNRDPQRHVAIKRTTGHLPTCQCNAGQPIPATVCDPFTGSGTTLQVAINTGRHFVGCELAEHYLPLIQQRAEAPWQPQEARKKSGKCRKKRQSRETQAELFT